MTASPLCTVSTPRCFIRWRGIAGVIGDVAASWDPLSSQGIMSAVLMRARVGRALDDVTAMQELEGDIHLLRSEHAALQAHFYGMDRR